MLLAKNALQVYRAASTDETRYSLNGILVEPDGATVATDGHIAVKFVPGWKRDAAEYPVIEGCNPVDAEGAEPLKSFILPSNAAAEAIKAIPKGKRLLPILSES